MKWFTMNTIMTQYHWSYERVFQAVSTAYTSPLWRQQRPRSCYEPKKKRHDRLQQCAMFQAIWKGNNKNGKRGKIDPLQNKSYRVAVYLSYCYLSTRTKGKQGCWYMYETGIISITLTIPCSYQNVKKSINSTQKRVLVNTHKRKIFYPRSLCK